MSSEDVKDESADEQIIEVKTDSKSAAEVAQKLDKQLEDLNKPAAKKEKSKDTPKVAASDKESESDKIHVRIGPKKPEVIATEEPSKPAEGAKPTHAFLGSPEADEEAEKLEEDKEPPLPSQTHRRITPPGEKPTEPEPKAEDAEVEPEPVSSDDEGEKVVRSTGKGYNIKAKVGPGDEEAAHKLDAMSGELKADENEKDEKKAASTEKPKVVDTKQYHLPIKQGRGHGSGHKRVYMATLLLILLVVGVLVVLDLELLDVNFKLPFNVL